MLQLLYVSTAMRGMTPFDIETILTAARARNAAADVTGMLLFADNTFLQILEGPSAVVEKIFQSIQKDPRHNGILMLLRRSITARNFQNWSMGFERVERTKHPQLNAVFNIGQTEVENRLTDADADQVMAFLGTFYTITTREKL